jgi:hypothetical protein
VERIVKREITIIPRCIIGRFYMVKLAEQGHGGNKWVPYVGTDPTGFFAERLARVIERRVE